jgi:hypothetical protein
MVCSAICVCFLLTIDCSNLNLTDYRGLQLPEGYINLKLVNTVYDNGTFSFDHGIRVITGEYGVILTLSAILGEQFCCAHFL